MTAKSRWAYVAGVLFGLGLLVSGMTKPANVLAFLDVFGSFDPSLALVMASAIGVHGAYLYWFQKTQSQPPSGSETKRTESPVNSKMVLGATIFGVGWGISGFCPGPALVSFAHPTMAAWAFTGSMALGMWLHQLTQLHGDARNGELADPLPEDESPRCG